MVNPIAAAGSRLQTGGAAGTVAGIVAAAAAVATAEGETVA